MILKKLAVLSSVLFYVSLAVSPAGAASGSYLDYGANNLSTKAPFWYPSHDWKFTWFFPATYTPVLRMSLVFNPPIHAPITFDPVFLGPQALPLPRNFNFTLPSSLQFTLSSLGKAFTPTLKLVVSFIPSGAIGGVEGLLGSGSPPSDLTVTLPSIPFKPVTDTSGDPFTLVLPLPDSVSVPVPDPLTIPSPFPGGSTLPVPSPDVSGGSDALPPGGSPGGYIGGEPTIPAGGDTSAPAVPPSESIPPSHSVILSFFSPAPTPTTPPDNSMPPDGIPPTPPTNGVPTPPALPTPTTPPSGGVPTSPTPPGPFVPPIHSAITSFFVPVPTPSPVPPPSTPTAGTPPPIIPSIPTPSSGSGSGVGGTIGGIIDSVGGFVGGLFGLGSDFGDAPDGSVAYPDTSSSGSGGESSAPAFCTSYVDSTPGPYKTTATAICGFTCVAGTPTIDFYHGDGTPFIGSAPPSYAPPDYSCNGKPTLGPSSIGCSCK